MNNDFKVNITNPERRAEFLEVFGTDTVNVVSPFPQIAKLPGKPKAKIFKLDIKSITAEQRTKLVNHLARKFNIEVDLVDSELDKLGMPILFEDCTVIIKNPQRWI